ncbi:MAG: ATP-binding cassette domain-containing protein [Acidobacteriota bacterium]
MRESAIHVPRSATPPPPSSAGGKYAAALRLLSLRDRVSLLMLTTGRIAVGLCDLLVAAAMYLLFLTLQGHTAVPHLFGLPQTVLSLGIITATLVVTRSLADSSTALLSLRRIHHLQTELLLRLVRGYSQMQWTHFVERNRSELVNFAIHTTRDAADFFHRWIELVASVVVVLVMAVAVIWKSPPAAAGVAVLLAAVYALHRYGIRGSLQTAASSREDSVRRLQRDLTDLFSSGKEIRTYRLQSFFSERIRHHAQRMASGSVRAVFLPQVGRSIADQGAVLIFLVMVIVVQLHQSDTHGLLALLAFYFVLSRRLLPLTSQIALIAGQMESAWEHVRIVDTELQECLRHRAAPEPTRLPTAGYAVELSQVSFSYLEDKPILTNLDFRLREGEIVVLQGASGSGKSSLLNLIAGIADPRSGTILCDRARVCYVPQEVPLLDDSIRTNLLFGSTGIPDEELMRALRTARLDQFVAAQPSGLAAGVGDNGSLLSGGQRQRLGLARALVRGGDTLLLDEATSALDEDSEREILEALAASGKAVLLATHRVRAHLFAHRVLQLCGGELLEERAYLECRRQMQRDSASLSSS